MKKTYLGTKRQIKAQEQLDSFITKMEELGTDELIAMAHSQLTQK